MVKETVIKATFYFKHAKLCMCEECKQKRLKKDKK